MRNDRRRSRCRRRRHTVFAAMVAGVIAVSVVASPTEARHAERERHPILDSRVVEWPRRGQLAFTFDDGPEPSTTSRVLDVLAAKGAPATFFVNCYRIPSAVNVLLRMINDGHRVQNHTTNHPWLVRSDDARVRSELGGCSHTIGRYSWDRPTLFRPPYGATSPRVRAIAASLGLGETMWNASPSSMDASTSTILGQLSSQIAMHNRKGNGVVVLLHDGSGNRAAQVAALSPLIDMVRAEGWELVRLG